MTRRARFLVRPARAARDLARHQVMLLASNMPDVVLPVFRRLAENRSQHGHHVPDLEQNVLLVRRANDYAAARRFLDVGVAILALTIFGLFLPLIALIIRLDSPGPVFYIQKRVGMDRRRRRLGPPGGVERRKLVQPGRPFLIYKLRTMHADAEANGPQWATRNDRRITRVGRFLRGARLDEIPQFINVLRGEMSLIGPRPERLCFIHQFVAAIPHYRDRLLVMPGITGLAQVINGYDDSAESVRRKIYLDRLYIRHAGPTLDFRILLATFKLVLTCGKTSRLTYPQG